MSTDFFTKYGYVPDADAVAASLGIIASNLENAISPAVLKECFSIMDLTSLHPQDTEDSIARLCEKVNSFRNDYPEYPLPASICVFPNFAPIVKSRLNYPDVHVTTVSGCFPASQSFLEVKLKECEMAVLGGADEVDIVLALNAFLAGDYDRTSQEISAMRECVDKAAASQGRKVILKVILETGVLMTVDKIANASFLAMESGADFIKTSTGKVDVNATPSAAFVMCQCIAKFYEKTGKKVGFKAAGGISNAKDAVCYYSIVSTVLGKEWLDKSLFRFGVSKLANQLISAVEKKTVTVF